MSYLKDQISRFRTIIIILVILIIALILIIIRQRNNLPDNPINTVTAQIRDIDRVITGEGNFNGQETREIYSSTGSKVIELRVSLYQLVEKDNTIAVIETQNVMGSRSNQEIKTPIKGVITEINYNVGDYINGTNYFVQVTNTDEYRVSTLINESDIKYIKPGQETRIKYPAISDDEFFDGEVILVYPTSSSLSSSTVVNYKVDIKAKDFPANIKLGMSADVEIYTESVKNALSVPDSYIIEKENKYYVKEILWNDENKNSYTINEKEVQLGLRTNEYAEIISGINENSEIAEPDFSVKNNNFGFF